MIYYFKENWTKIRRESAAKENIKKAVMTSLKQNFQKMRKVSSQNLVKVICVNFHQNRPNGVAIKCCDRHTDTHIHTHTHTHIQTHRQASSSMLTYSVMK